MRQRIVTKVFEVIGGLLLFGGIFYIFCVAGTSDFEAVSGEVLHSFSWYVKHGIIAAVVMLSSLIPFLIAMVVKNLSVRRLDRMIKQYGFEDRSVILYARLVELFNVQ